MNDILKSIRLRIVLACAIALCASVMGQAKAIDCGNIPLGGGHDPRISGLCELLAIWWDCGFDLDCGDEWGDDGGGYLGDEPDADEILIRSRPDGGTPYEDPTSQFIIWRGDGESNNALAWRPPTGSDIFWWLKRANETT